MTTLPAPPVPGPYDEEEENGATGWEEASYWAQRGDLEPLVAALRGASSCSDRDVLDFLADYLAGNIKRPRGKPTRRPHGTFWQGADGQIMWIDQRDVRRFEIAKWIEQHRVEHGKRINEAAAEHFGIEEDALANMMRRSSKAWQRSRST